jgi:hypothetical protein
VDLEAALAQFERAETNISRLEAVAKEMEGLVPEGISFADASPEAERYENLRRSYDDLLSGLPPLNGYKPSATPKTLDDIAHGRMGIAELDEPDFAIGVAQEEREPAEQLAEYRYRFSKIRRSLVRDRAQDLMKEIDNVVAVVDDDSVPRDGSSIAANEDWQTLVRGIGEIERLLGPDLIHTQGRWHDLHRHLGFAQGVDFRDIAEVDWPSVRPDIEASLYGELEPLPVEVDDLGTLAETRPTGPVSTELAWDALDDEDYERLLFNLLLNASGYENPQWLQKTRAADKGRDLSVDRVIADPLGDTRRERVIVQCRHWLANSMSVDECAATVAQMALWEPPHVDVLIFATSGRFTADAIRWIENHNEAGKSPRIEMWPDTRLETLLATRPALVREFGLRRD